MSEEKPYSSGTQFADEIITALNESGIDLSDSQSFSFHLRVPSQSAAQKCAAEADLLGLETEVAESDDEEQDDGAWLCVASMEMTPARDRLIEIGEKFIGLADEFGGDFAGWEVNTDELSSAVEEMFGSFFEQLGGLIEGEEDAAQDEELIDIGGIDFDKPLSDEADRFLKESREEFNVKQAHLRDEWRFEEGEEWAFDPDTGNFRLEFEDGSVFQAEGQILGSHDPEEETWEWAWNNPNVEKDVARDSLAVRELGERLEIDCLCAGKISLPTEEFVSYLCSLGVKATDSFGIYSGEAGALSVAVLLKNPQWASPDPG